MLRFRLRHGRSGRAGGLVEQQGERKLWAALSNAHGSEETADIVISTAHKAKGREWDNVRLASDFSSSRLSGDDPEADAAVRLFVVAAIVLFNCRYLGRVLDALRSGGGRIDPAHVAHLSPLGWDHINLGDYVWSDSIERDPDGFLPLRLNAEPAYR